MDDIYEILKYIQCGEEKYIKVMTKNGRPVIEIGGVLDQATVWTVLNIDANGIVDLIKGLRKLLVKIAS